MKRIFSKIITLLAFSFFFTLPTFAADSYTFDPAHTYVLWHINHFGFSNPSGKWLAEGSLVLDSAKPENSKVNATIHVADFITGIPKLDEHLKGDMFFNVAKFPTATFVSNEVKVTGKDTAKILGTLTVHGVSKPVTLDVTLNKMGTNPITMKPSVGFTATTQLKRSDFGINAFLPGLGDEVIINIEAEAFKAG